MELRHSWPGYVVVAMLIWFTVVRPMDIYVHFTSNRANSGSGFFINYRLVDSMCSNPDPSVRCDPQPMKLQASATAMEITSPNYPSNYPRYSDISWLVESPGGQVKITLVDYDIQLRHDCSHDYLAIHDGMNAEATELAKICGYSWQLSLEYCSTSSFMYIHFVTNSWYESRGYKLNYETVTETNAC